MSNTENQTISSSDTHKVRKSHYVSSLFVNQYYLLDNSLTDTLTCLLNQMSLTACDKVLLELKATIFNEKNNPFVVVGFSQFSTGWGVEVRHADGITNNKPIPSLSFFHRIKLLKSIEDAT